MTPYFKQLRRFFPFILMVSLAHLGAACGSDVVVEGSSEGSGGAGSTGTLSTGSNTGGGSAVATVTGTGGASNFKPCQSSADCSLVPQTCCGVCGVPELEDVLSVNVQFQNDHKLKVCGDPPPPCPYCATEPNPNLYAFCEIGIMGGTCVAEDIRKSDLSACQTDSDCSLRFGLNCCEPCGGSSSDLVAINRSQLGALEARKCDAAEACDECVPNYPNGVTTTCTAGQCQVAYTNEPPPGG